MKISKRLKQIKNLKNWLIIEIGVLAAILIAVVVITARTAGITRIVVGAPQAQNQTTEQTQATQPENGEQPQPENNGNESVPGDATQPGGTTQPGGATQPSTPTPESGNQQQTQPSPENNGTLVDGEAPSWKQYPADRQLTAEKAFVYNCNTEEFTFLKGDANEKVYPASITKLLTAYVALRFLLPTETVTAGDVLDMVGEGSSLAKIQKGDTLTVEELIAALLLPSGNDAAYILAEAAAQEAEGDSNLVGPEAVKVFMREMNGQAKVFGMNNTHFTNPDGYHESEHYTTFSDMVRMVREVMQVKVISDCVKTSRMTMTLGGESVEWKNTNQLVDHKSEYYCVYATGAKTGQTPSAGSCLLTTFDVEGQQWVIGVFGCPTETSRFDDTLQLFNEALGIGG